LVNGSVMDQTFRSRMIELFRWSASLCAQRLVQQLVGPDRRERVHIKRDSAKLVGSAPPGQF
jgi:hypothetical protein